MEHPVSGMAEDIGRVVVEARKAHLSSKAAPDHFPRHASTSNQQDG